MKTAFHYVDHKLALARAFARSETNRIARESLQAIQTDPDARAVAYGGAVILYCACTLTLWAIIFVL